MQSRRAVKTKKGTNRRDIRDDYEKKSGFGPRVLGHLVSQT